MEFLRRMHQMVLAKISLKNKEFAEKLKGKEITMFDYHEMWKELEKEKKTKEEQFNQELKFQLWNVKKVPKFAKLEIEKIIDGDKDVRKDVISEIKKRKNEIEKDWSRELSEFILSRISEYD